MSTALMQQMIAVVDVKHYDAVTKALLRTGVLHFIKVKQLGDNLPAEVKQVSPKTKPDEFISLRRRIETLFGIVDFDPQSEAELDVGQFQDIQYEKISGELDGITRQIDEKRERQRTIQQEIMRIDEMKNQLGSNRQLHPGLFQDKSGLLAFFAGKVPAASKDRFEQGLTELPVAAIPAGSGNEEMFVLVVMKKYRSALEELLAAVGWERIDMDEESAALPEANLEGLERKIRTLKEEQKGIRGDIESTVLERRERLLTIWRNLKLHELYSSVERNYAATARTLLFSGWVPKSKQKTLDAAVRKATDNTCYIEWNAPDKAVGMKGERPPVKFTNPKFLQPFQMLVQNYAIPEYGTFDPTPVVAVAYLLMFGTMFGDVGHGLVLLIAGIIGSIVKRGEPIGRLFQLIIYCGAFAVVFGVLFGSYFGMSWFPPLWFDFHGAVTGHSTGGYVSDIYGILQLTIYFGIGVIGIGLIINWINCIRTRRWVKLFLDKTGILGGWMYGAGVYTAMYFGNNGFKDLPPGGRLLWMLGIPAVLFFAKPVVEFIIEKRDHGKEFGGFTVIDFIMEWIVEMLEVFSGYLANTLSFMRVAGLGIAHVSLMTAFFQIAGMIGGESYNIGSYLILILGNLLVIVLEGLSAGIQSLRLNYYEFFSKYFTGSGIAYSPVSLKKQNV